MGCMLGPILLAGIPTWALIAAAVVIGLVIVVSLLKKLFKLALIVAAVAAGVWLGLQIFAMI